MRTLILKYKKKKRKASHLLYLRETIDNLHNEIVQEVLKTTEISESKITNKARLLKKYNRRLKWLLY